MKKRLERRSLLLLFLLLIFCVAASIQINEKAKKNRLNLKTGSTEEFRKLGMEEAFFQVLAKTDHEKRGRLYAIYFLENNLFPQDNEKELFEKFGIDKFAEVKVADMSTGMKQKISLVISIVHNPDIIIFDEPTNGLDVITERIVVNFLKELREQGKCIIISSHIFSLIEKICDRVVIIIRGKSVCCDTLENVMAGQPLEDRFFELYENMEGKADE